MATAIRARFNALIDAAQAPYPDLETWTAGLLDAAGFLLESGCGFGANLVERTESAHHVPLFQGRGVLRDATIVDLYDSFVSEQQMATLFEAVWQTRRPVVKLGSVLQQPSPAAAEMFKCAGASDSFGLIALGGPGRYFALFSYLPQGQGVHPAVRAMLAHVRPYVETGLRLRGDSSLTPIAVLTSAGKLLHLHDGSALRAFTPELTAHIARLESIRLGRDDVEVGPDAWEKVCFGRWFLTQCSESDGRQYYVVFEDHSDLRPWHRVSETDRKIVEYSVNGLNGRQIATQMKISEAQVSTRLAAAARSLGLRSRSELLRLVAILNPSGRSGAKCHKLTQAEREILAQLELGRHNEEIAAQRGRSVKTVANQVAAILRKTATTSRRAAVGAAR